MAFVIQNFNGTFMSFHSRDLIPIWLGRRIKLTVVNSMRLSLLLHNCKLKRESFAY